MLPASGDTSGRSTKKERTEVDVEFIVGLHMYHAQDTGSVMQSNRDLQRITKADSPTLECTR